ncbi:MAG TPA: hypothetical protein VGV38_05605 [Pyrinomonadaceae bacterium]|nr:hypothetical protein [Pyrinomonadaceae bacterium]
MTTSGRSEDGDVQQQAALRFDGFYDEGRLARIEDELSRARRVLYLLVKDDPDMVRLLGYQPAAEELS